MAEAPTLTTPRLRLEAFEERHMTERYVDWLNDPDVVRYSEQRHRRHDLESCRAYKRALDAAGHVWWALVVTEDDLGHIGNLTAHIDEPNGVADLGILIGERRAWGRGYGLEAWRAACDYMLGDAAMRKVTAGTLTTNEAMLSIMRNAGMVEDGRRRRHMLWEDGEVDVVHRALFRESTGEKDTRA